MRQSLLASSVAAVALFAASSSAQVNFFGRTMGSFEFSDSEPPLLAGTMQQFFITFEGPATFDTVVLTFEIDQALPKPDSMSGMVTFFGPDPANSLSGTFEGISFPGDDGVWTGAGLWTASEGTGLFAGLSGEGEYSFALTIAEGSAATTFSGTIIPAPATSLVFGTLLLSSTRRRRSAAC